MTTRTAPATAPRETAAQRAIRRARRERRWSGLTLWSGVTIVVGVLVVSLVGHAVWLTHPDAINLLAILQAPSPAHPFGTDSVGRDVLARVFAAAPLDYEVVLLTTLGSAVIGIPLGVVAGYFGGLIDAVVMRLVDVVIVFPMMIFVLAFIAVYGPGLVGTYVGLIAFGWAFFARVSRAEMLVIRERQYILAARALGLPRRRILFVHAMPNLLRPNLVVAMATIVWNLLTLAALSFLGIGVQPPRAEWGAIIAAGQVNLFTAWWVATLPGLVIVLVGVGFSLIGDGITDRGGHE